MDRTQIWLNGLHGTLEGIEEAIEAIVADLKPHRDDGLEDPYDLLLEVRGKISALASTVPLDPKAFERLDQLPSLAFPPVPPPTVGRPLVRPRGPQDLQEGLEDIDDDDDDEKAKKEGAEQFQVVRRMGEVPEPAPEHTSVRGCPIQPEQPGIPAEDLSAKVENIEQMTTYAETGK